ncbi:MAG: hypothetical protein KGL39_52045 [Patescibacteria group bacterium]|nr:hypothetical protein [Patescibacteria group bacterium]
MGACSSQTRVAPAPPPKLSYDEFLQRIVRELPLISADAVYVSQVVPRCRINRMCAKQLRKDLLERGYFDVRFARNAEDGGVILYVGLNTEVSLTREEFAPETSRSYVMG